MARRRYPYSEVASMTQMEDLMTVIGRFAGVALTLVSFAASAQAQSISFGLRGSGGFPTGSFAETSAGSNAALVQGAKSGFGYGADLGVSMGPLGVYAG